MSDFLLELHTQPRNSNHPLPHNSNPQPLPPTPVCGCPAPVFYSAFSFDWPSADRGLRIISVSGPAVFSLRDRFAEEVDKHAEWSEQQIAVALRAAGAKYGPDHMVELLRAIPLGALRPVVAGEIEVTSAEFHARGPGMTGGVVKASLVWIVRGKWRGFDGRETNCTLAFDAFEGKLELFSRGIPTPEAGGQPAKR